uniref:Uncharacterized protein n=1 Tax=Megaselia scalaris TaxID=36166 RepID=T1H1B0_MEGSC
MVHAREAHTVNIYELGSDLSTTSNNKEDRTNDEENSSDGDHFCVIENSLKD